MNKHALWVAVLFCIGCAGATNAEVGGDTLEQGVTESANALFEGPCAEDQRQCRATSLFICNWEGKWVDQGIVIGECGASCQDNLGGCGTDNNSDICWGKGCVSLASVGTAVAVYHCDKGIPKVEDYCVSVRCEHEDSTATCEAEDFGAFCKYSSRSCNANP